MDPWLIRVSGKHGISVLLFIYRCTATSWGVKKNVSFQFRCHSRYLYVIELILGGHT